MEENSKPKYQAPSPKTVRERIEWMRQNDPKFKAEEKMVEEARNKIKPK